MAFLFFSNPSKECDHQDAELFQELICSIVFSDNFWVSFFKLNLMFPFLIFNAVSCLVNSFK